MKEKVIIGLNIVILLLVGWVLYVQYGVDERIAYVNSNYLISNYEGFKAASGTYEQKAKKWQANVDTLKKELRDKMQEYKKEKKQLSAKERKLTEELLASKEKELSRYQQGIQQKARQEDQKMTKEVVEEINAYIKDYGKKHDYKIIFGATDMGNIVYAKDGIDLTEEVLKALNKNYRGE